MDFKRHSDLEGRHAFLSASTYHWINYDEEKLRDRWYNFKATQEGTILHSFAAQCITLQQRLPKAQRTLNLYVNDAIGYHMTPEQVLYFSDNCFGTTDAICFRKDRSGKDILRIHDLKTGSTPAHMEQLYIYAALFCLEYGKQPDQMEIETRIYQFDQAIIDNPPADRIFAIMEKIVLFDKYIEEMKAGE